MQVAGLEVVAGAAAGADGLAAAGQGNVPDAGDRAAAGGSELLAEDVQRVAAWVVGGEEVAAASYT